MCTASYNEIVTAAATAFVHDLLPLRFVLHNYPNIWLLAENSDEDIPIVRDECGRSVGHSLWLAKNMRLTLLLQNQRKYQISLFVCVCAAAWTTFQEVERTKTNDRECIGDTLWRE